jgi:ABC-2 type transport system permease protein
VLSHFLFFIRADFRNKIRRRLSRLRSPRYAIAMLIGLAYFFFAFGGPALFDSEPRRANAEWPAGLVAIAPFYLAIIIAWWWLGPGSRFALNFTPADVNLLFTAPLTRRQLIQLKLLRSQVAVLFTTLIATFFARRAPGNWWLHFVSSYVLFSTLFLHQTGAELVHASAKQHGRAGWRRVSAPLLVFAAWVAALGWSVVRVMPKLRAAGDFDGMMSELGAAFTQPPASIALAPLRILLKPMLSSDVAGWAIAFVPALLVLAAHYFWVVRTGVAFEESAAEAAERRAALIEAMRTGKRVSLDGRVRTRKLRPPWFPLAPNGEPAIAILWKNVLYTTRNYSLLGPTILILGVAGVLGFIGYRESGASTGLVAAGATFLGFVGLIVVLGPLGFRNDLRMDLKNIQLLRTFPIDGPRMVGAQLAGSTLAMASAQIALLVPGVLLILLSGRGPAAPIIVAVALAILLLLPGLTAIALAIQNGIALWIPAWTHIGAEQAGGVEFMGAHIMNLIGSFLIFALALVPPALAGAIAGGASALKWGNAAYVPATLIFIAALYIEAYLIVLFMGRVYDRIDPIEAGLTK